MASVMLFFLVVLFAFVDVWYFVRVFHLILKVIAIEFLKKLGVQRGKSYSLKDVLNSPSVLHAIVLPSDIDHHLHMNNSKYLREMDFGRQKIYFESGMAEAMRKLRGSTRVAAISIRYRRSLQLWERFTLSTKALHWSDAFYLEQRFLNKDGFTCAIAMVKMIAKSKDGQVPTEEVAKLMKAEGESEKSPPPTPELKSWMESLERSSESMKKEGRSSNFVLKKNS
jgi:acyl-CoA thioesterase FadM